MVEEVLPVNCGPDPLLVIHRKETWVWRIFQRQQLSHLYALLECDLAISSSSGRIIPFPLDLGRLVLLSQIEYMEVTLWDFWGSVINVIQCPSHHWNTYAGSPEPPYKKSNQMAILWGSQAAWKRPRMRLQSAVPSWVILAQRPDMCMNELSNDPRPQPTAFESFQGVLQACEPETTWSTVSCLNSCSTDSVHIIKMVIWSLWILG